MYNRHSIRCGPWAAIGTGRGGKDVNPPIPNDGVGSGMDDDCGSGGGREGGGGFAALPAAAKVCASARCANKI
jgi:hypothetical protein